MDIQVYLTPDQQQAFGWHYDLEEVFIIQVQGCKEYTLRQNTVNPLPVWDTMPEDMGYERETSRIRMTCRLEAGDWLYIPSGWWHIARTQAASLHLSIGVMPVTRLKLFAFLARYLAQFPFWCQRLALVQPGESEGATSQGTTSRAGKTCGCSCTTSSPRRPRITRSWPMWWMPKEPGVSKVPPILLPTSLRGERPQRHAGSTTGDLHACCGPAHQHVGHGLSGHERRVQEVLRPARPCSPATTATAGNGWPQGC